MMKLNLVYPPTPQFAPQHADLCVMAAKEVAGCELDYTDKSLHLLDDIIQGMRVDGLRIKDVGETLFTFGCYVGEVLVRHCEGEWCKVEEESIRGLSVFPLIIKVGSKEVVDPISQVFNRLETGRKYSLPKFYQALSASSWSWWYLLIVLRYCMCEVCLMPTEGPSNNSFVM